MAGVEITTVYAGIAGSHIKALPLGRRGGDPRSRGAGRRHRARHRGRQGRLDPGTADPARRAARVHRRYAGWHQEPLGMSGVRLEARVHIVTASVARRRTSSSAVRAARCRWPIWCWSRWRRPEPCCTATKRAGRGMLDIGGGTSDLVIYNEGALVHPGAADWRTSADQRHCARSAHADERGRAAEAQARLRHVEPDRRR